MREQTEIFAVTTARATTGPILQAYSLRLRGIRFEMAIGASAEERAIPQEVVVDVDLSLTIDSLPRCDLLSEVVDYDSAVRQVVETGAAESYHLLESYAARVLTRLLSELPVLSARVAITKKNVPTSYPVEQAVVELVGSRAPSPLPWRGRKNREAQQQVTVPSLATCVPLEPHSTPAASCRISPAGG